MENLSLLLFVVTLIIGEIVYFKIADYYNIIDKPNHRSSHTNFTLRGGGIIFPFGMLIYPIFFSFEYPLFLIGLFLISTISFIDDIRQLSNKLRLIIQIISVFLLILDCGLYSLPFYWLLILFIVIIGVINAINFMDGINGLTGIYALVTLITLLYINCCINQFIDNNVLLTLIFSVAIFLYFNFRIKAKCFAGDVGSVSIAFILLFLIAKLVLYSYDFSYILLLTLYGMDVITTIVFRIIRKEKISEAHRSHFYQFLANERKLSHLVVSGIYAILQLIINIVLLKVLEHSIVYNVIFVVVSTIVFVLVRIQMEGLKRLIKIR